MAILSFSDQSIVAAPVADAAGSTFMTVDSNANA